MISRKNLENTRLACSEDLCALVEKIGYGEGSFKQLQCSNRAYVSSLLEFFDDNPGAMECLAEWIAENNDQVTDGDQCNCCEEECPDGKCPTEDCENFGNDFDDDGSAPIASVGWSSQMENNTTSDRFVTTEEFVGGSLQGYVTLSYAEIVKVFGEPGEGDAYKVSSEWSIHDVIEGKGFTLYDWKETELYSQGYPTVEQFRAQSLYDWHIGGDPDFKAISKFLTEKLGRTITATRG